MEEGFFPEGKELPAAVPRHGRRLPPGLQLELRPVAQPQREAHVHESLLRLGRLFGSRHELQLLDGRHVLPHPVEGHLLPAHELPHERRHVEGERGALQDTYPEEDADEEVQRQVVRRRQARAGEHRPRDGGVDKEVVPAAELVPDGGHALPEEPAHVDPSLPEEPQPKLLHEDAPRRLVRKDDPPELPGKAVGYVHPVSGLLPPVT